MSNPDPAAPSAISVAIGPPRRMVEVTVDGQVRQVPEGSTLLDAARAMGADIPTLCYGDTLTPKNACRVCMVEVEGARVLAPSCSRKVEPGMVVHTDSPTGPATPGAWCSSSWPAPSTCRAAPEVEEWMRRLRRRARPLRDGERPRWPSRPRSTTTSTCGTTNAASSATSASTPAASSGSSTFAIAVAGRGFDSRISTEWDTPLPDSACVYCGNCVEVCPTGALSFLEEFDLREAGKWDAVPPDPDRHDLPLLRCRLHPDASTSRTTGSCGSLRLTTSSSPDGNLCIKGRFGFPHVQP